MNDDGSETPQRLIKARVHFEWQDRIHNDLGSAAHYFEKRVGERFAADDREGIFFDMLAAVTMAAFAMEANLNFIGQSVVEGWDDWNSFGRKLKLVLKQAGIKADMSKRPYLSVERLKKVRDAIAHGKPQVVKQDFVAVGTHDELQKLLRDQKAEWEELITPDFVREAYADVQEIWKQLLDATGIDPATTLTQGSGGLDFLGHVDEQEK